MSQQQTEWTIIITVVILVSLAIRFFGKRKK